MAGTRLKQKLTNIADSIRIKLPSTALMTLDEMPPNIEDIVTHEIEDALLEGTLTGTYTNDRVTTIAANAFRSSQGLTHIYIPNVISLGNSCIYSLPNIIYVYIPNVITIGNNAFYSSRILPSINAPKAESVGSQAFMNCVSFEVLNLYDPDRTTIPTLVNINAFNNTLIASGTGYIVINDELVDQLKQAENWSTYAAQIIGHTQAIELGLIEGASTESASVPAPAPLQITPIDRLDINEINIDPDLDLDLDLENNERI